MKRRLPSYEGEIHCEVCILHIILCITKTETRQFDTTRWNSNIFDRYIICFVVHRTKRRIPVPVISGRTSKTVTAKNGATTYYLSSFVLFRWSNYRRRLARQNSKREPPLSTIVSTRRGRENVNYSSSSSSSFFFSFTLHFLSFSPCVYVKHAMSYAKRYPDIRRPNFHLYPFLEIKASLITILSMQTTFCFC